MCNLYRGPSIDADDDDRRQTIDDGCQIMAKANSHMIWPWQSELKQKNT